MVLEAEIGILAIAYAWFAINICISEDNPLTEVSRCILWKSVHPARLAGRTDFKIVA